MTHNRWVFLCPLLMVWMVVGAGCGGQQPPAEQQTQNNKKEEKGREAYTSLFTAPQAPKQKLASDLNEDLANTTFYNTVTAESRKHDEVRKKQDEKQRQWEKERKKQTQRQLQLDEAYLKQIERERTRPLPTSPGIERLEKMGIPSAFSQGETPDPFRTLPSSPPQSSHPIPPVIIPVASLMMRSPTEVSRKLGQPTERNMSDRFGSKDLVCYYQAGDDVEPVRVVFDKGQKAVLIAVTFKQPVKREKAFQRAAIPSLTQQPKKAAQGNLVWDGGFAWKEGRITLEAAQKPADSFWGIVVEALIKVRAAQQPKVDESWGVGGKKMP